MSSSRPRVLLIAALILGYACLEHYSNRAGAPPSLGASLAIAPALLAVGLLIYRSRHVWIMLPVLALAALAGLVWLWPRLEHDFARLYLLQQCGIYLSLAITFGRSLLPGRTALCTRWACKVHGTLDEEAVRYTRAVTVAWTVFFVLVVAISALLYLTGPRMLWSAFSNFAVLPLAAAMFVAECQLRRRQLPSLTHAGVAETLRIFLADSRGPRRL